MDAWFSVTFYIYIYIIVQVVMEQMLRLEASKTVFGHTVLPKRSSNVLKRGRKMHFLVHDLQRPLPKWCREGLRFSVLCRPSTSQAELYQGRPTNRATLSISEPHIQRFSRAIDYVFLLHHCPASRDLRHIASVVLLFTLYVLSTSLLPIVEH